MRLNLGRVPIHRRLRRGERGQTIVLAALLLLFVSAAVMLTFAIGYRTREKIKLQALADSGAYSISVAEARLFNYFAWSNRTHVSHDVAILSVHAHASYITYMESLYKAGHDALHIVEIEMFAWCIVCVYTGECCQSCENASKFGDAADEYWGDQTYEGQWLHDKWHDSENYDKTLMAANNAHYLAIGALYAEQKALYEELRLTKLKNIPQTAAQVVDKDISSGTGAAAASASVLADAVSWGPSEDWKEIVSATRDTAWLYNRSFSYGLGWISTFGKASQKLGSCFHIPSPSDSGNAKTTDSASSYSTLQSNIHKDGDDSDGWGRGKAYGAEDHGGVSMFGMCDCPGYGYGSAYGGLLSGPKDESIGTHFYFHAGDEQKQDESDKHDMGGCSGNSSEDDPDGTGKSCGIYYRHPRYRFGNEDLEDNKLWNHPHPVVVLTKDTAKMVDPQTGKKYPFEFNVNLAIPVPVHFQTLGNQGDQQAGNKMAAISGGLVYYHKPQQSDDNWKEPPSFWNPFWRAKLHPLKGPQTGVEARGLVLGVDHPASAFPANSFIRY